MHFRFLAGLFALVALVALVLDVTPTVNGGLPFRATTLAEHWKMLIPASFEGAKRSVTESPVAFLWPGVIEGLLNCTSFVALSILALLFGYVGRRRRRIKIFAN